MGKTIRMTNMEYEMVSEESRKGLNIYLLVTVGVVIGSVVGLITMPQDITDVKYTNSTNISVSNSSNQPLQPTSVGADQLGSAVLWNQQGGNGSGVQSSNVGIDQIIGNSEIKIK